MGVYIPNMDKPKNAFNCSIKINPEERRCIYTGKVFEETLSLLIDRPCDDCPLIEIDESEMEYLYREFGLEKDDNLTDRAKELKRAILMGYLYAKSTAD